MSATTRPVAAPVTTGRWVGLRHVRPDDVPTLYEMVGRPDVGFRWRFRGQTPSYEEFHRSLWSGVTAQFVMHPKRSSEPLGMVTLYNMDARHGISYVALLVDPRVAGAGFAVEGLPLMLGYGFTSWSLRKIYAEVLEFNFVSLASWEGRGFEVEGVLKRHEFYGGEYWDLYLLSCTREMWHDYVATGGSAV